MLPRITPEATLKKIYQDFLTALRSTAFSGEIQTDYATRLSVATDNSIYQVIPQAVLFPRNTNDIAIALKLASEEKFSEVTFSPRGGGTATNGQSLSPGIIIDCSRHMREIIELNLSEQWVRVQPGVVLDQLNSFLKKHNVHFAPEISPSNRATIGGMVNTNACGNGSRVLGRTGDHVLELTCVISDGSVIQSSNLNERFTDLPALLEQHRQLILEKFVDTPRTLGGYDLKKGLSDSSNLLYGAEGTLAVISECKLKLTPIPKFKKLVVIKYRNFNDALLGREFSSKNPPLVIEAIDEKLIDLARHDAIYLQIKDFIENENEYERTGAVNLVEFVSQDENQINQAIADLCTAIDNSKNALGYYIARNAEEIRILWDLRKKSVGLISKKLIGTRRPIPFVEDTAVPPEKLADYINEFKNLLNEYGLIYGMYGHVDAGCVHVRPALDMKLAADEKLIREISDKVVALIKKYGGVLWGEHGQGHRCEYGIEFFGEELYNVVRKIKTQFDPNNKLNPGKIAVSLSSTAELVTLNGPMRGQFDRQIPIPTQQEFATTITCNGNGACFNFSTQDPMCPSFKVTQDRIHSPKGRAGLMREWLRQLADLKFDLSRMRSVNFFQRLINSASSKSDFSHEVFTAMSGCLSCKACAAQCPLNVDVPEFKSKFLSIYYQRYLRPLRDYLIASIEFSARLQSYFPKLSNWFLQRKLVRLFLANHLKLVDPPLVNKTALKLLKPHSAEKKVILLQDAFTSYFEPEILQHTYDLLTSLGYNVQVEKFFTNGKPLHAKGFLNKFSRVVKKNILRLRELAKSNTPMLGIDPSITLTYRDEYQKIVPHEKLGFKVMLLQEWLLDKAPEQSSNELKTYYLLSHCTEKTACPESESKWKKIFAMYGLNLIPLSAGCCGMAGSYGHEAENLTNSKKLFAMDWQKYITDNNDVLATGYSCRSQAKRILGVQLQHPVEALLNVIKK